MDEDGGAREVPEKAHAEPVSGVRPGDEARDVGQDEARLVVHAHDAEMRREGGEGKVRDPRACGRDGADERRLPDVREADEPDVGQHAEPEPPSPPSPPLGPPRGTYFSRRKLMQPLPPSPASTRISTSSMNFIALRAC